MNDQATAKELLETAWSLRPRACVAALARAAELADAANDVDLAFEVRSELVHATYYVPGSTELITTYSWLVAKCDEDPERFSLDLWFYKWVAHALPRIASVTTSQITGVLDDLDRRFTAVGEAAAPALKLRMLTAVTCGNLEAAREHLDAWLAFDRRGRSGLNDCAACDHASHVCVLIAVGDDAGALEAARPLLDGSSSCTDEPELTLGRLLAPLRRLGDGGRADELRKEATRIARDDPKYLEPIAYVIRDHVATDDLGGAFDLIATHRRWLDEPQDDLATLEFCAASRLAIKRAAAGGVDLPDALDATGRDTRSAADVAEELCHTAEELAQRFDARNGNSHYTDRLLSV